MAHGYNEHYSAEENTAMALYAIANELSRLGTGGALTDMGAIEFLAVEIKEGLALMGSAIGELAQVQAMIGEN